MRAARARQVTNSVDPRLAGGTGSLNPGHRGPLRAVTVGLTSVWTAPVPDLVVQQSALYGPENQTLNRPHPLLEPDAVDGVANGDWLDSPAPLQSRCRRAPGRRI